MTSTWQRDWHEFVRLLSDQLQRGTTANQITALFDSKDVEWSGILKEKSLDDLAPLVTIVLPAANIDLGDAGILHLSSQSIPVARDAVSNWEILPIGSHVTFTAVLGTGSPTFPSVEVIRLDSGRTLVMIRLREGRPSSIQGNK